MVGTGYTQSTGFYRGTSDFEVIDLSPILSPGGVRPPTQLSCDPLPDLPESGLANAAGAFWDDLPHVCGGVNGFDQLDGCYRYERGLGRWIQVENLTLLDEPRFAAASWNSPGSNWFIHDGVSGPVLSEREITLDQGQDIFREYRIESGLNNEHGVAMHAMVRLFIDMEAVMDDDIIRCVVPATLRLIYMVHSPLRFFLFTDTTSPAARMQRERNSTTRPGCWNTSSRDRFARPS